MRVADKTIRALYQDDQYVKAPGPSVQQEDMGEVNLGVFRILTSDGTAVLKSHSSSAQDNRFTLVIHHYLGELGYAAKVKAIIPAPAIQKVFDHHDALNAYERTTGMKFFHEFGLVMDEVEGAWNFLKSDRVPPEITQWNEASIIAQIRQIEAVFNQLQIVPRDLQLAISKDGEVKIIDLADFAFVSDDGKIYDHRREDRATNFQPVDLSRAILKFKKFYRDASSDKPRN